MESKGDSVAEKPQVEQKSNENDNKSDESEALIQQLKGLTLDKLQDLLKSPAVEQAVLAELTLKGVADAINAGSCKKVVVMAGAGVSVAAGIPDFRTPGTGLYDNLQKYNLPYPTAVFQISYFRNNPKPFYMLAKELYPGSFQPTPMHYLIRLLHDKGILLRAYTQNIDGLERIAGVPDDKLVEAHGTFHGAHCIDCRTSHDQEFVKDAVFKDEIPKCQKCKGLVKPDIVFFGESLPDRFATCAASDFGECDLLIVMGTSLQVQPFASLVRRVRPRCPRLLLNRESVGEAAVFGMGGFDFTAEQNGRDVRHLGDVQESARAFVSHLGWEADFEPLLTSHNSNKL